ncbi:hypothetical protein ABTF63_19340, partial [Acinetobacter baumannii]
MPADISRRQDQAQKTSAAQDLQREHGIAVPSLSTGVVHDKQRELASKRAQMRVEMAQSTQDEEITHNPILRRG